MGFLEKMVGPAEASRTRARLTRNLSDVPVRHIEGLKDSVWLCVSREKLGRSTLSKIRESMGYDQYTGPEIMFVMDQLVAEGRMRRVGHGVWEVVAK